MQDLAGKTAFVTGGASGIGLGIAKALLGEGMKVVVADIREDHLEDAREELDGRGDVLPLPLDVTDREAYAAVVDETERKFGKIHLLVNNAEVAALGPVELAAYGDWDWTLGVCLGGTINGIVTILPRILAHGEGGHIVSTASMSGLVPHPGAATYVTAKSAIVGLMESMRAELEDRGVICSAFCPGVVQSNIAETGYAESGEARQASGSFGHLFMTKEEVGQRVLEGILAEELYILTHSEFLDGVRDRAAAMVAAVPHRRPENHEYKQTFARLFRNPVHAAEIARQEKLKA
ncbi:MAG TPA: SDR family NAD(P)-dependent oxidoreductase [Croceibacterium sp.]